MTPSQRIQAIKSRLEKALTGPGKIMMTRPMDDSLEEEIIASIRESIRKSRGFKDGLPWWWVQMEDGRKIAEFGCGPTSEANALFYGGCAEDLPFLLSRLEAAEAVVAAAKDYMDAYVWWTVDEYDRERPSVCDLKEALSSYSGGGDDSSAL